MYPWQETGFFYENTSVAIGRNGKKTWFLRVISNPVIPIFYEAA